ncbi:tRNA nucleotidyltransferase [Lysinibacillus contaminans]|uniref:CCA-adding enzyme n=1 Tax=Lysinibacillus contaminans TaxID=1293441 RepID=A0ABR5K2N6_9BACI|nr:CCA tRNA nucleotidyltransferase [Lysinibacillus contaminans]KOS69141.1 tRNA nucleotidyltransferase [Lysinibacillus contaminans]
MQNNKEWQAAFTVIKQLENAGYEAVVVGGAVRDALLGRAVHDVDVATSAMPSEVKEIFAHTVDIGIQHGTVLVIVPESPVEVTTYRTDGEYTDHRRPEVVQFVRSLAEDLRRRDFTMNAIAMRRDGSLVDYYGGREDIEACVIRAVGEAQARFAEDALRMLRAARFAAQLSFTIEPATKQAMHEQAADIEWIAIERVKAELDKLWVGKAVYNGLLTLVESGLATYLPGKFEAEQWQGFSTKDAQIGWAYFAWLQGENWPEVLRSYRLSNKETSFIKAVLAAFEALQMGWTKMDYFTYSEAALVTALDFSKLQKLQVEVTQDGIREAQARLPIRTRNELVVNGLDLQNWSGQKRGPWLKEALQEMLEAVVAGEVENERQHIKDWFELQIFHKG